MDGFLNARRLRGWVTILAIGLAVFAVVAVAQAVAGGDDLAADFTCYAAAARMILDGDAPRVYDPAALSAAEHALRHIPAGGFYPFYYPPPYMLLLLLLGVLPYWLGLAGFLLAGLVPLVWALRRILVLDGGVLDGGVLAKGALAKGALAKGARNGAPGGAGRAWGWLPILAYPGLLVTAGTGQNGFVTAACLAWFGLLADARPYLAGMCLGLLACKPHLALLAPVALLAAGRWRCVLGAAGTFGGLCAASFVVLGPWTWEAFFKALPSARGVIEGGMAEPAKVQSWFMAARLLGAPVAVSYGVQLAAALVAAAVLIWACRRWAAGPAQAAALAAAALCASPYLADYDLVCLAPALAWAAATGARRGWRAGEKPLLILAYLLPLLSRGVAAKTGLLLAPVVTLALLVVMVARRPDAAPAGKRPDGMEHDGVGAGGVAAS